MGKRVKEWTPPTDAIEAEAEMQTTATAPKPTWVPPQDAVLVEDPVKKKDVAPVTHSPSSSASAEPGQPSVESTEKPTPTRQQKVSKVSEQKPADAKPIPTSEVLRNVISQTAGPGGVMAYDFARRVLSGFTDDIPKALSQGLEVAKSSVSPLNVQEYILNNKSVDFQRYVRDKEGIPWYKPFGADGMNQYINKYADQFMKDSGLQDVADKIKANQPKVIERRLKVEKSVQQQKQEAAEKMSGAAQSFKDIHNLTDLASYIGTLGGQAAYQIPLSVLSRGSSSLLQESATIYDQQLDNLAADHGITREEVIKRGLDKPAEGQAYAVLAASLDRLSAGNIISAFKQGGGSIAKRWAKTAIPEAVTEPVQGVLEDVGSATGSKAEALGDALTSHKRLDELAGGLVGGTPGAFATGPVKSVAETVNEEKANITNPADQGSVEAAAEKIEKAIEDAPPAGDTGPGTPTAETAPDTSGSQIKPSPVTPTDENSGTYNFGKDEPATPDTGAVETVPAGTGQPGTPETTTAETEGVLPVIERQASDTTVPPGDGAVEPESTRVQPAPDSEGLQKSSEADKVDDGVFKLGDQDTFYHSSPRKRQGRLIPNDAKNLGKGVYFATDKKSTEDEFGDTNTTAVKLNITNPVEYGSGTPEWQKVQKLALEKYNKDQRSKFKGDPEDFNEQTDLGEIPATYVSDAAVELGHDAITQKNDLYGHEINVLDESKIVYQEDAETPQQKANRELDALVASGDISRDGKKVTILTEKGGREAKRIHEELKKAKSPDGEGDAVQPVNGTDLPGSENSTTPDGRTDNIRPAEDGGGQTTDQEPPAQGGVPTDTPPPTDSVALDQSNDGKLSGIKKALVPEDKVDSTPIERRTTEDVLQRGKQSVDSGQINPKAIVDRIADGDARALQADEVSALVYYKAQLDNKSDSLNQELIDAIDSGDADTQVRVRAQLGALNNEIDRYHEMSLKTAYEQSLAFRMRQMLLDNEYNLASQILKYKATNNGEISTEVEAKFKKLDEELKAANLRIKALEEQQAKAAAARATDDIKAEIKRQQEIRLKTAQARKAKINDFFNSLKVKSDPNKLNNVFQVVGEGVYNGAIDAMRVAVLAGADVATAIQAGVDYINEHYRGTDFKPEDFQSEMEPKISKVVPTEDDGAGPAPTVDEEGRLHIPAKLIRQFAEISDDIDQLTDNIFRVVQESYPDVTRREVRDAITRYGETKNLSKDELDAKIREMKRVGRLLSSLEDVQGGDRPKRSGLQRDKPTDKERRLMKEVKEAMKDLPIDQETLDRQWKTALDAVKSRLRNQISDLENQIKTGEKTPKKKGIEYDQEANELKEQRDKLRAIIQQIEGKPKMSDEQKIRLAIAGVERNIAELERRINTRDVSSAKRSVTPVTPELQALRDRRSALREVYKQLQDELGATEQKRLEMQKAAVQKAIERFQKRIDTKDFTTQKKKPVTPDSELIKLKLERDKIKREFDVLQEKNRYANRPWNQKAWDFAADVWNLPKSFVASVDMSAPFRQGAILSISNPAAGARSFKEMFSQAFSEQKANEWLLRLKETDLYAVAKNARLYLAEPTTKHTAKEEQFMSNLAGKIPVWGALIKGSERAYTGYLNKLRVDVFANGADILREQGMTPQSHPDAYKALAQFINNATGRGNLGGAEMAAPLLNTVFFSPRYIASRVNLLNPVTYIKMPAPVRKMALKSMVAYIGFNSALLLLADAAFDDLDVEWDPRSSDFGKFRIGDTRFDPWAGFQQIIRFIAQFLTAERKSTKSGEISKLNGIDFPFETQADLAINFFRSKVSPALGAAWNLAAGENMVGEEVTPQGELIRSVVPLYLQDMEDIYREEGPTGIITTAIPAFFGVGVQNFGAKSGVSPTVDPEGMVGALNKKYNYSISQPDRRDLSKSMKQEVSSEIHAQYVELRENEIKRLFERYEFRLKEIKDQDIYDKSMDAIVREADRKAKERIARQNNWDAEGFKEGKKFRLRNYVKRDGKVVERASLLR